MSDEKNEDKTVNNQALPPYGVPYGAPYTYHGPYVGPVAAQQPKIDAPQAAPAWYGPYQAYAPYALLHQHPHLHYGYGPQVPHGYAPQPVEQTKAPDVEAQQTGGHGLLNLHNDALVKGLVIGAGLTYLLTNETVQRNLIGAAVRLWSTLQGGVEEVKERFRDAEAELHANDDHQ